MKRVDSIFVCDNFNNYSALYGLCFLDYKSRIFHLLARIQTPLNASDEKKRKKAMKIIEYVKEGMENGIECVGSERHRLGDPNSTSLLWGY